MNNENKSRLKKVLSWIAIILLLLWIIGYFYIVSSLLSLLFDGCFKGQGSQEAASVEMAKIEKTETKTLIYCEECDSWDTALHIHVKAKED